MPPNPFTTISKEFVRGPLGIIALFIVLVYAMAGIVATSSSLAEIPQILIVIFLVVFPFTVLFVFFVLVTKHSEKLYPPSEFSDETLWARLQVGELQRTDASDLLRAWIADDPSNRDSLRDWLRQKKFRYSVTLFLNHDRFKSLQEAAVAEFGIQGGN